jgi:hypothetical protein
METLQDVENIIDQTKKRIALFDTKLKEHESGTERMSAMAKVSTETKLEEAIGTLQIYEAKREELLKLDAQEREKLENEARLKELELYAKNQKNRFLSNIELAQEVKNEVLKILDELPQNIIFMDEELVDLGERTLSLSLREVDEHLRSIKTIRADFDLLFKNINTNTIKDIEFINNQILSLVLQFHTLVGNIAQEFENDGKAFNGLPKYEDWWIEELWHSHLAYFSLIKWKKSIKKYCYTKLQKKSWNIIFANWIAIKDLMNSYGEDGFEYQFAFDKLISKYARLNEETVENNLINIEKFIYIETKKEDFNIKYSKHNAITSYLICKRLRQQKDIG